MAVLQLAVPEGVLPLKDALLRREAPGGRQRQACVHGSVLTRVPADRDATGSTSKGPHNSQVSITALPNMELRVTLRPFGEQLRGSLAGT